METQPKTSEKTLRDYEGFLKENLTKEDKDQMAEDCECSITTIYNYLGGNASNKHLAAAILNIALEILSKRNIKPTV